MMRLSDAAAEFVDAQRVGRLATVAADVGPHVVPISTARDGDVLVFASQTDTKKVRNMRGEPRVAICFDEYTEDWSELKQVIVYGRATLIETGAGFERARSLLYQKFAQYATEAPIDEGESLIVRVEVESSTHAGI